MHRLYLCALAACPLLLSQTVRIATGVSGGQVIQRDAGGKADLPAGGQAAAADGAPVEARLLLRGIAAPGFDWQPLAKVAGKRWQGVLRGVPAGGPYAMEVRVAGAPDTDRVDGLLVGDLWLLAGQSNMEGRGYLVEAMAPDPRVHSFDMRDHWVLAEEPLHTRVDAADRVYWFTNDAKVPESWTGERLARYIRGRDRGTGLGLPFAIAMARRTGVPVGLIPCALGGTSMDQWSPSLKDKGGDSLYGATLRRARAAGGKLRGVVWYQGESDATRRQAPAFREKFERFAASLREDLASPGLPFYYVQIGRFITDENIGEQWNTVQEAQLAAETAIPNAGMAASVDLSLVDLAHGDAASLNRLGARVANLACRDLFPQAAACAGLKKGPRPLSATVEGTVVRVSYGEVNGRLRAAGKVAGFSIHQGSGGPLPVIYAADVDPQNGAAVLIRLIGKLPAGAVLRYGYGTDPYCNLVDEADMAAPAFGPMAIRQGQ